MYTVLARKWRPNNFEELVGQKHVHRTLMNAIRSDRLAHAYIFAGLRGTGKTTVARILAKCLNCEQGPTETPCGKCDACQEIAESRAMDVLEIDAASRTKVEQTRELLELVAYAPVRDRYKILIIDEAHMLSKASFNALLKTLEEPPPNVLFIMATTEIGKLLPTILSRCQVFEFRRVATRELVDHLRKICDAEEVTVSDASLERIARAGEGSVRDSLSVLERVLAFCGKEVDDDDLLRLLGGVRAEVLTELLAALDQRDAGGMLQLLDRVVDEGHDLLPFWREWIASIRDVVLIREMGESATELLSRSEEEAKALSAAVQSMSREDLTRAFQLLSELEFGLRSSSQPRYLFESAMIRLASLGSVQPIEEVLQRLQGGGPLPPSRPTATSRPAAPPRSSSRPAPRPSAPQKKKSSHSNVAEGLIDAVRNAKPMIAAILEQADEIVLEGEGLVVAFAKEHRVIADRLRDTETLELLRQQAESVTGNAVNVRIDAGEAAAKPAAKPAAAPAAKAAPAPEPAAPKEAAPPEAAPTGGPVGSKNELLERAKGEPGVKKLLREFGAQVVDIRPLTAQPIVDTLEEPEDSE